MYPSDSANVSNPTFYVDSLSSVPKECVPLLKLINTESYSEKIENQLKKNILFQPSYNQNQNNFLPQHLIISYKPYSHTNEAKIHEKSIDWFFLSFLVLFTMLAIIKLQSFRIFSLSLRSIISDKFTSALSREGDFFKTRSFIFILIYSCFGMSLITYAFLGNFSPSQMEWLKIVITALLFTLLFLLKIFLIYLTGQFFNIKPLVSKYIQQIILTDFYIAVFIFPLAFVYYYNPFLELLYIWGALMILILLYRIIKGFLIFSTKFYMYENFLYFCTVEILPILLLVKFFVNQI